MKKIKNKNIVICVSWPYANNNLHLGYVASSLSGDVLARYHRVIGDNVLMVSGTDSHGTKIILMAKKEGISPKDVVDRYHANFVEALDLFGFTFDKFGVTYDEYHKENAKKMFEKMHKNGYIYEKTIQRPFCEKCDKFVVDTEIEIECPVCGKRTKADNCDCGYVPTEEDLVGAKCLICSDNTVQKTQKILVFKLSAFKDFLQNNLDENKNKWRANSINETQKYLDDIRDRDFSRDLSWGVDIPIKGYEDKVVWVWYEALLGYVTDVMKLSEERGFDWRAFWKKDIEPDAEKIIYMCHAKDNIVFHSMIFPAMLEAMDDNWVTPNFMVSAEYLLMNNEKISKSTTGSGKFDALDWAKNNNTDTLRFHFLYNGPEKRDSNFSYELYAATHNEVVNKLGNLVNRTLNYKNLSTLPSGKVHREVRDRVAKAYSEVGEYIEKIEFKKACGAIIELVDFANKYYDEQKPWVQSKESTEDFNNTIFSCAYIIANLSNLLEPFMPNTAESLRKYLELPQKPIWDNIDIKGGIDLKGIEPLFERIKL